MLRTALKPRWLGLLVLALAVIGLFWRLGLWQLHVAQDKGSGQSTVAANPGKPPVAIDTLLHPHEDFPGDLSGRVVTMTGSYAADGQVLVAGRRLDGVDGYWVLTPLYAEGSPGNGTGGSPSATSTVSPSLGAAAASQSAGASATASGTSPPPGGAAYPPGLSAATRVLAVVRGFVTDPTQAPRPPSGRVTVTGSLAPGESPSTMGALPEGQLGAVDLSVLVNQWQGQLYDAFVFATAERGPSGAAVDLGAELRRIPPPNPTGGSGLAWRNAAYALQWWIFALFAAWMWVKVVRDDWLTTQAARGASEGLADNDEEDPLAGVPAETKDERS